MYKKIYTKQIMLDGTAELKTYVLENNQNKMQEQQAQQNNYMKNYGNSVQIMV